MLVLAILVRIYWLLFNIFSFIMRDLFVDSFMFIKRTDLCYLALYIIYLHAPNSTRSIFVSVLTYMLSLDQIVAKVLGA